MKLWLTPSEEDWWEAKLRWMMEYRPADLYRMWKTDRKALIKLLDNSLRQAMIMEFQYNNLDHWERREIIAHEICPEDTDPQTPADATWETGEDPDSDMWLTLPEDVSEEIVDWMENPPKEMAEREITVEVPDRFLKGVKIHEE